MVLLKCRSLVYPAVLTVVVGASLWSACSDDDPTGSGKSKPLPSTVSASSCKNFASLSATDVPSDQDCIEYFYDGSGTVQISHVNAAFNCCPDSFVVEVDVADGVITIEETDALTNPCHCLCLYDTRYSISGIGPGTYTIDIVEKYLPSSSGNKPLRFSVNFPTVPSGTVCVLRFGYPWGVDYLPED